MCLVVVVAVHCSVHDVDYRLCSYRHSSHCMMSPLSLSLVPGDVSSGFWLLMFLWAAMWGPDWYVQTLVHGSAIGCTSVCARTRACVRGGMVLGTNTLATNPQFCACFRCRNAWRDKCDLPDRQNLTRFGYITVAGGGRFSFCVSVDLHRAAVDGSFLFSTSDFTRASVRPCLA